MDIIVIPHIKEVRKKKNMTVRQLAKLTGISNGYISDIENGNYMPSIYLVYKIAAALEVELTELYSYEVQ